MGFARPELLLLALPALLVVLSTRRAGPRTAFLRGATALLIVVALARPYAHRAAAGRDLVIVIDRSRSMPSGASEDALEIVRLAEESRQRGDRVAVVSFGADVAIESLPSTAGRWRGFERPLDPDGSSLSDALHTALELVPDERPGSILVLSDGESQGEDPASAAREAASRGIAIDVRPLRRERLPDLSVEGLDLPDTVAVGEPFQFSAWVRADERTPARFALLRDGVELSRGERVFEPGYNRLLFRDVLVTSGVPRYELRLEHAGDPTPENDRAIGALEPSGAKPVLLLSDAGAEDSLSRALAAAGIPLVVRAPEGVAIDPLALRGFRAVILENVAATRLGPAGLDALADFVVERGGGLLLTGGRASFGVGGYHLTPVDEVLPVSMEVREEHRKLGISLVVVLDRSGSMAAPAGAGLTKMDLANQGAASAIALLTPIDAVGVIAVDSSSHVVADLAPVEDVAALVNDVRRVRSEGGGIFVYTGLLAAARMLEGASHANRHVILFADAADAEEPENVPALVDRMVESGTTVSVIALGSRADPDARFLESTAKRGGGEIYFCSDPASLPRLFAQDTLKVARSTFLEAPTPVTLLPERIELGELPFDSFPDLAGYNLNYLRPGATAGAITADEYRAPILAFWRRGLGRVAAYCGQVGGSFGQEVVAWDGCASFFVTLARWLAGEDEPADLFASVRREGGTVLIAVEADPEAELPPDTAGLAARLLLPDGTTREQILARVDEHRFEARLRLDQPGIALGTVRAPGDRFKSLPPIALPYSPEFERPAEPDAGLHALTRLAKDTGGEVAPSAGELFRGSRRARAYLPVANVLAIAALLALIAEIAARRFGLLERLRLPRFAFARRTPHRTPARADLPTPPEGSAAQRAAPPPPAPVATPVAPSEPAPPAETGIDAALARARDRARRRLDR